MDYENKYKKALEKARQLCAYPTSKPFISDLQDLFPELKESEDERIIREITEFLVDFNNGEYERPSENTIDSWLAWLEKQGKQKSLDDIAKEVTKDKDTAISFFKSAGIINENGELADEYKIEQGEQKSTKKKLQELSDGKRHLGWLDDADKVIEGEQKSAFEMKTPEESLDIDSDTYNKIVDECIYGEHKPSWSEEDELHIREHEGLVKRVWAIAEHENDKDTIHEMSDLSFFLKTLKPQLKQEWSEEDEDKMQIIINIIKDSDPDWEELINWLKSLKDRVLPQPKQEWSEEDERLRNSCISHIEEELERIRNDKYGHSEIISDLKESCRERINWLNSLRPQKQWKPSEKQMNVLNEVLNFTANHKSPHWNDYIFGTLNNLIRQLKKLREE